MYEGSQIQPTDRQKTISNKDGQTWCDTCNKRQPYDLTMQIVTAKDKDGISYSFLSMKPHCRICKRELWVAEILDANADARYKAHMSAKMNK